MEKRPLYLATNIGQLNKKVDTGGSLSPRLDLLCKVSNSLYTKANQVYKSIPLDEEMMYILCLRYLNLVEKIKKKEKDSVFHKMRFGKSVEFIHETKTKLELSLLERYKALEDPKKNDESSETTKVKETPAFTFSHNGDMFVSSEALYKIMTDDRAKLLIIDIRSQEEYLETYLKHSELLNIPGSTIIKGLSTNTLKKRLPSDALEIFEARTKYDYIVLMDLETPRCNYNGSKLEDLRTILVDWDLEEKTGLILVLDGGLRGVADTHPTMINNPLSVVTHIFNEFDDSFMGDITYPDILAEITEAKDLEAAVAIEPADVGELQEIEKLVDVPEITEVPPLELEGEKSEETTTSDISVDQAFRDDTLFGLYSQVLALVDIQIRIETQLLDFAEKRLTIKKDILDKMQTAEEGYLKLKPISAEVSRAESVKIANHERRSLLEVKLAQVTGEKMTDELVKLRDNIQSIDRKVLLKYQSRKKIEQEEIVIDKEMRDKGLVSYWEPTIEMIKTDVRPDVDRRTKPTDNKILHLIPALNDACKGTGLVGLFNIRNTCYLNSLVQCLRFCPPFIHHLTFIEVPKKHAPTKITYFLVEAMCKMWNENYTYIQPSNLYTEICRVDNKKIGFALGRHEDVQEFYLFLMKNIHNEMYSRVIWESNREYTSKLLDWHKNFNEQESFITRMFYHQLEMMTQCPKCDKSVAKFEYGNTVFVNIPDSTQSVDIFEELQNYLAVPSGETTRFCNDCEMETVLKKRITYYPTILAVNIVRYYYDSNLKMIRRSNNECLLTQEIYFGSCRYELRGISMHQGDRELGHYTALCYHPFKKRWVEFNDIKWSYADLDTPSNRVRCYMLFYTIAHNPSEVNKKFFLT